MSNITIFEESSNLPTVRRQSRHADKMGSGAGLRRIATNTNGTFKRIVGGEQIGKAVPHELDVIIIDWLKDVSRQFYATAYDPDSKPTLPDCWSALGDKPDAKAPNAQSSTCAACPKNVEGSGTNGKGKACRFQRRVAVLVAGDPSGEVYQMSFAATSLFGKGVGNVHPFESYKNFLRANGEGLDTVVTRVMYDLDADTMKLKFKAVRHLTETEAGLVDAAQDDPDTQRYIQLTVAETDGATRAAAPAAIEVKPVVAAANPFADDDDEEEPVAEPAPVKRGAKKETAAAPKPELASVLNEWLDDDEEV